MVGGSGPGGAQRKSLRHQLNAPAFTGADYLYHLEWTRPPPRLV